MALRPGLSRTPEVRLSPADCSTLTRMAFSRCRRNSSRKRSASITRAASHSFGNTLVRSIGTRWLQLSWVLLVVVLSWAAFLIWLAHLAWTWVASAAS